MPTWRGVLLALGLAGLLAWGFMNSIHSFLTPNAPLPDGAMVLEGWLSDGALRHALYRFRSGNYDWLYVTGGPVELGGPLMQYKNYADVTAASLISMGMDTNRLQAVSAPQVMQDRTYASAVALRQWLARHGRSITNLTVVSEDAHARRSRLLFEKAFGGGVHVGIISIPTDHYEPKRWWASSPGVRVVISEAVAYGYARLLFWP